jgi:hypothetical protein
MADSCNRCENSMAFVSHEVCILLYGNPVSSEYRAAYDKVCENLAVQKDGRQ